MAAAHTHVPPTAFASLVVSLEDQRGRGQGKRRRAAWHVSGSAERGERCLVAARGAVRGSPQVPQVRGVLAGTLMEQATQVPGDGRPHLQLIELFDGDKARFESRFPGLRFRAAAAVALLSH